MIIYKPPPAYMFCSHTNIKCATYPVDFIKIIFLILFKLAVGFSTWINTHSLRKTEIMHNSGTTFYLDDLQKSLLHCLVDAKE